MKKCKEGHYYCFQDSKCKPIPKGFRRGVGGYLRREREDEKEDSKKNGNGNGKSNGSSNGNGNGGNGSGNGNGSSGGNGGGNGSGGVGESVEIQNSDGETTALVTDIIGPDHMRPRLNGKGVWTGTHITEVKFGGYLGGVTINPSASRNQYGLPDNLKPESGSGIKEVPLTPTHNRLLVKDPQNKIDSDVLKANPHLDPLKPGDYKKLKRLTAKVRKAHYEPDGISLTEVSLNPSQFLGALNKAKQMSRTSKMNQAIADAGKTNGDPNLTKSDSQVTQVGDQPPIGSGTLVAKNNKKGASNNFDEVDLGDMDMGITKNINKVGQRNVKKRIKNIGGVDLDKAHYEPDGELTEYAAAIPAITSASKFVIPALKTAAAATIFKMGKEYIKKKFRPKEEEIPKDDYYDGGEEQERIEKEAQQKMKDKQDIDQANKKQLKQINKPKGNNDPFSGSGKKIDAETRKRMNAPIDQFNSYDPLIERKMTEKEKRKDDRLKKKYDKSDMKKSMQKQYGKEEGKKVYFATIRKQAMEEEKHKDHEPEMIRNQLKTAKRASKRIKKHTLKKDNFKAWVQSKITKATDYLDTAADYLDSKDDMKEELDKKDKPYIKKLVKNLRKGSKTHAKQADKLEKAMNEESNPRIPRKKGQPANSKKHSDLYTDENPKGTIHGLGFKDVATAKASVAKIRKSNRSHAHKIQAAVAMEQRAREMGKTSEAAVYRKFINSMKKKTKK